MGYMVTPSGPMDYKYRLFFISQVYTVKHILHIKHMGIYRTAVLKNCERHQDLSSLLKLSLKHNHQPYYEKNCHRAGVGL